MLKLVDNSDWHDNLSVEGRKQFNLANQYEIVKLPYGPDTTIIARAI